MKTAAQHIANRRLAVSEHWKALRWDVALRSVVMVGAIVQFVDLLIRSRRQWDDFSLTTDFATFNQVWWTLGHGHLNPFDTLVGRPFWHDEFAVVFWPIGLLWPLSHSSYTLLVVQDLCLAGATVVAGLWVCDAVCQRLDTQRVAASAIVIGATSALVIDPWAFETAGFDVHVSPFAALFLLLCGRALWRNRRFSPYVWGLLAMSTGTAGAGLTIGLGAGAVLISRRLRVRGLLLAIIGVGFLGLIIGLNANQGTTLDATYGYLAGGRHVANGASGVLTILSGIVHHPNIPIDLLWSRRTNIGEVFRAGGIIGLFSGWGAGVAAVNVLESGMNAAPSFSDLVSGGFQNYPVVVITIVSSALSLTWILSHEFRRVSRNVQRWLFRILGVVAFASVLNFAYNEDGGIQQSWVLVWPGGVAMLSNVAAALPGSWEVVASQGLVGRFADRQYVYSYVRDRQSFPLKTPHALFLMSATVGIETVDPPVTTTAIDTLMNHYHGHVIASVANNAIIAIVIDRSSVPGHTVELPAP